MALKELDTVKLPHAMGGFPAGTVGTIVDLVNGEATVEIDQKGWGEDFNLFYFDVRELEPDTAA